MRIIGWNINHRSRARKISNQLVPAIEALAPDVLVLTECAHNDSRAPFLDALRALGLKHILTSDPRVDKKNRPENNVLVAARSLLERGDIHEAVQPDLERLAPSLPSNLLHVRLPDDGFELLGLRVPDYSKQPKVRRACWEWLLDTAAKVRDRPFVLVGDFNTDSTYDHSKCGDCIGRLKDSGWCHHQFPENPPSYRTPHGHEVCIDHCFVTAHFDLQCTSYVAQEGAHVLFAPKGALSDHAALRVELRLRAP
jgi:endonuclease/exonuclease/phosphatase family metal-dependent hydrolase